MYSNTRPHPRRRPSSCHDRASKSDRFRTRQRRSYARTPDQTPTIAREDLNIVRDLGISHLSWYQLTIEPNTTFYSKPPKLPNEDTLKPPELIGSTVITSMGLQQYEVSAFATPGEEAKHNMNYWELGDYFGIGAGAHGKITTERGVVRTQRTRQPFTIWHELISMLLNTHFQTVIWGRVFDEWSPTQIRNLVHPLSREQV